MSETIDYGGGDAANVFSAPVMRIDDQGHGFHGVVYKATTRQATDYESGKSKWFVNKKLVLADEEPANARPVLDYIFHIACKAGRGAFTVRDDEGEAVKLPSGRNKLEVRDVSEEDIAVVMQSAWNVNAVRSVKLNTGHEVKFKRTTPARDENGDRMTRVDCEITIVGKVDNPQPYKQDAGDAVDWDDAEPEAALASSPF